MTDNFVSVKTQNLFINFKEKRTIRRWKVLGFRIKYMKSRATMCLRWAAQLHGFRSYRAVQAASKGVWDGAGDWDTLSCLSFLQYNWSQVRSVFVFSKLLFSKLVIFAFLFLLLELSWLLFPIRVSARQILLKLQQPMGSFLSLLCCLVSYFLLPCCLMAWL